MKHLDYMKHKSEIARMKFDLHILGRTLKPEKFLPIKSDPHFDKPSKQRKNKNTSKIDIPSKTKGERVQWSPN